MPQKRKDRPSSSPSSSTECNNSPDEKRSKAAVNEVFVALNTMEALDTKIEAILKKLEKLDTIESQLSEVHTRMANIEETVSRLDAEVRVLKSQKKKLEKNVEELEEGMQYNDDDISDLQRDNKKLENDVYELKKQLMYMENYSRRENLKFFGVQENIDPSYSGNDMDEGSSRQYGTLENTKEVLYQFLEEQLKIDRPREKIEFQRVHRLGKPNPLKSRPIIARFLRFSDREFVMEQARKHLKDDENLHVFDDIPKELYDLRKEQIQKLKKARQRGYTAYFSKAHPDKLFVNGKYVAPERPLEKLWLEFMFI